MRKLLLLFCIIFNVLFANTLMAQLKDSYVKGIITLKDGQNINANIKLQELEKLREGVFYKTSLTDSEESFYSEYQIEKVSLETGAIYKTLVALVPKSRDSVSFLASLLLKGNASLYETSYNGSHVYIITNKEESYWLQEDEIIDGKMVKYHYRNILLSALRDYIVTEKDVERIKLNDKELINLIGKYNASSNSSVNEIIKSKNKYEVISYIIPGVGGMHIKSTGDRLFYFQAIYQNYFPLISKNSSLNTGLFLTHSYYKEAYDGTSMDGSGKITHVSREESQIKTNRYGIPLYFQQNFWNRAVRPYVYFGMSLFYEIHKVESEKLDLVHGLYSREETEDRGIRGNAHFGLGLEANVFKRLVIKAETRFENAPNVFMLGLAYKFQLPTK